MKTEKILTIPLQEYNDLVQQLDEFKKAQKEKFSVVIEDNVYRNCWGTSAGNFKMYTKDDFILELNKINGEMTKTIENQSTRIRELLNENVILKQTKKSFW